MYDRKTTVLVVSPHDVITAGISTLLAGIPDLRVTVGGPDQLMRQAPSVALIDFLARQRMGQVDLQALVPDGVAVLALLHDLGSQQTSIPGVDGYVPVTVTAADLAQEIRSAAARGATSGAHEPAPERFSLTQRELDVLIGIANGLDNSQIAADLFLGINTVKTYIRSAYRRIGVTTRTQAVLWCIDNGLRP